MMEKKGCWREEKVTVASYIPKSVYNALVKKADEVGKETKQYCSLSELIRDILTEYLMEVKA